MSRWEIVDSEPEASDGGLAMGECSDDDYVVENIRDMRLWE